MTYHSRADLRVARDWLRDRLGGAVLVSVVLMASGIASAAGMLRWQAPFARWSFAALCWGGCLLVAAVRATKPPKR